MDIGFGFTTEDIQGFQNSLITFLRLIWLSWFVSSFVRIYKVTQMKKIGTWKAVFSLPEVKK